MEPEDSLLCSEPDITESEVFLFLVIVEMGGDTCKQHERLLVNY
jgi:hypothetical protein